MFTSGELVFLGVKPSRALPFVGVAELEVVEPPEELQADEGGVGVHVELVRVVEGQREVVEDREVQARGQEHHPELDGPRLAVVDQRERPDRQVAEDVGQVEVLVGRPALPVQLQFLVDFVWSALPSTSSRFRAGFTTAGRTQPSRPQARIKLKRVLLIFELFF